MGLSKIRVGVYGASGSGKTGFLRRLVQTGAMPVSTGTKTARFMSSSIGPDGSVIPTTVSFENIEARIDETTFLFGDWPGNILAEAVDRLDMERRRGRSRNLMVRQIARSDVLLFFFDPTSGRFPDRPRKHYREELLRAKQLIDYVLESRQNRLLPILFVLGRNDLLQSNQEEQRSADAWTEEVEDYLEESYLQILSGYYPKSLVRKEYLFYHVAPFEKEHAGELLGVMEKARSLVALTDRFRRRDKKRSRRLVILFAICTFLMLFIPILCLTSPTAKNLLLQVRDRTAPVFGRFPSLPASLSGDASAFSESAIDLEPLLESRAEPDEKTASSLNRSLFILMQRLNQLEDADQKTTEEYRRLHTQWTEAFKNIDARFETESDDVSRERLKRHALLLTNLADSPHRTTKELTRVLENYWRRYRRVLLLELRGDLAVHRSANSPPSRLLDDLCERLQGAFREVAESGVRGSASTRGIDRENDKEALKQDIRKAFVACRNYSDRYPVEIRIRSAAYDASNNIDRDFLYRLIFSGGKEKSDVTVDLAISSGFGNDKSCTFLPSRQDITVSFALEHPLHLTLQRRMKGSQGEWERVFGWEISSEALNLPSLDILGVHFYLRFENDENTLYAPEGKGFKFDLVIRRPRNVPDFLWEIVDPGTVDSLKSP